MHLKSITLKGFKSFPDRTRLEFDSGVSVVVGPNGSGKSNVTDAILWALGEQRPLAIRGQSMQDVIFGGGAGVKARESAEVELVLDNSDGTVALPLSEISVVRKLDRNGEGEYRLNGAKCRLTDVQEFLSDTGLGKEAHSVVSQGRVEAIVTSKPKDRRLLIEEAAGLGKHRKRRRRAQLKLNRTRENLDQALLVEQEARKQLGPLKRQSEAAELHERLERQTREARWELARDGLRERRLAASQAEAAATAALAERDGLQQQLDEVSKQRREAEEALAQQAARRDKLAGRVRRASSAADRIEMRLERVNDRRQALNERIERRQQQLDGALAAAADDQPDEAGNERITVLEAELVKLDKERQEALQRELVTLEQAKTAAAGVAEQAKLEAAAAEKAFVEAERALEEVLKRRGELERATEESRRNAASVGAQLAAANQFLRTHGGASGSGIKTLSDGLRVATGHELAVAAALQGRLGAVVAADPAAAMKHLAGGQRDGIRVLLKRAGSEPTSQAPQGIEAQRLSESVSGDAESVAIAAAVLGRCWLIEELPESEPAGFAGCLVTAAGELWDIGRGEISLTPKGGADQVLAQRNLRDQLIAQSEQAVQSEAAATAALNAFGTELETATKLRDEADQRRRGAQRAAADAAEALRTAELAVSRRREAPEEGAGAVRRAQILGELAAEQRTAQRLAAERQQREQRIAGLRKSIDADKALQPVGVEVTDALAQALKAVKDRVTVLEKAVADDRAAGDGVATALRTHASAEAELSGKLRSLLERLTASQVAAQRANDHASEIQAELADLSEKLGLSPDAAQEPLSDETREELAKRVERLTRRREQLGPVNPLALEAYEEAREHVEELERQRTDLETALRELQQFLRDTDRQIRETFEQTFAACAKNFEELAAHVFPGGRGRLRLVQEGDGEETPAGETTEADDNASLDDAERDADGGDELYGVEIEITPAGKSMKRLTLMSGGEKSMTAIAFLFSVFLAKPCPFYVLDEVEAALDDLNIDRFLALLREYRNRAQFIVVTHQKRTMEVADALYGVSMGGDGVSKVVSRRLARDGDGGVAKLPGLAS